MKNVWVILILLPNLVLGQIDFSTYYNNHNLPEGILEAYSWSHTHMQNIDNSYMQSCSGMPLPFGIMGLFDNGQGYFIENANMISSVSGISIADQKANPELQIEAFAIAFESIYNLWQGNTGEKIYWTLLQLSEIPATGTVNQYARDAQAYDVLRLLNDIDFATKYGFNAHRIDLESLFGANNYEILSSKRVLLPKGKVISKNGTEYSIPSNRTAQYGPALWAPTDPSNYSSRNGVAISAITIHTIQGSYAGAISWAQNPSANVSYHYVIRSSDGQVTQMVLEEDKAWHVGSENPYTIGYEHEGFVSDPSWYTEELYISSADLSKDVTQSGYGIPPLRTFYGDATIGINTLGGCTKIKGHQHYPNQTHTDPGQYWDWEKYYRLINDNPSIQSLTTTSGTIYDSGGSTGNYSDDERLFWLIEPANAISVSINFSAFDVELGYDNLFIYDGNSINSPLIGVYTASNSPNFISSSGGSLLLEFRSDCGTTAPGWEASYTSIVNDMISPTTAVSTPNNWQTQGFVANFADIDNSGGSGIEQSFFHVGYFDGNNWSANPARGFYFDDFDGNSIHPVWTEETGIWSVSNGNLIQSDEASSNTNLHMALDQSISNNYLYHWKGSIGGSGSNRRAGLHILCQDPTALNRESSYFIWFRLDQDKIQFYKVVNDNFGIPLLDLPHPLDPNTIYDFKFSFDKLTGEMLLFIDDELAANWTDANPIQTGDYISFRTGNASLEVQDFTVYRSRFQIMSILVGADTTKELRYQNPNPSTPSGRIHSITRDAAENISSIASEHLNIDWTPPNFTEVLDGNGADIDTTYSETLEANWSLALDQHSGLTNYELAIGTSAGNDDVLAWNNQSLNQNISHLLANPIYNQIYYISVRAINGAGLDSTISSDGQLLLSNLSLTENELNQLKIYPNPSNTYFKIDRVNDDALDLKVYSNSGQLVYQNTSYTNESINIQNWSKGVYSVSIQKGNQIVVRKLVVE